MKTRVIAVGLALIFGLAVAIVVVGASDEGKAGSQSRAAKAAPGPTPPAENPFTPKMKFREPPPVRSSHGHLRATITAQNATVRVSGVDVAGTQTYSVNWTGGKIAPAILGPTLHARPGDRVELTLKNRLKQPEGPTGQPSCPGSAGGDHAAAGHGAHAAQGQAGGPEVTNLHFHGLHVTPREHSPYGDTVLVHLPNGDFRYRFKIPRNHDRGTFWYHAHVHQCTDDEVTRGLAGMLMIGDSRKDLPKRFRKIRQQSIALKDIQVAKVPGTERWQIDPAHGFNRGTVLTVNGLVDPTMKIRPGETQMWRLLNASSGVWYQVVLADPADDSKRDPFTVIAQDGNSLRRVVKRDELLIPPGARVDVLVTGPDSGSRVLKTLPFDQGFVTFPEGTLAHLDVGGAPAKPLGTPEKLTPPHQKFPTLRGPTRTFTFDIDLRTTQFTIDDQNAFNATIDNADFDPKSPRVTPLLATTERWIIYNKSAEWHPFHIHQDDFRVVSSPVASQRLPGDHDIVALPPGTPPHPSRTVIDMPFTDYAGNFVFHCHILGHEDAGMMALVEVRKRLDIR
jgi:suppressor of ftsI